MFSCNYYSCSHAESTIQIQIQIVIKFVKKHMEIVQFGHL